MPLAALAFARRVAGALTPKGWLAIGGLIAFLAFGAYCANRGAADQRARQAKVEAKAERRNAKATVKAADERLTDHTRISAQERSLTDAVSTFPDARPSDARVALACQRLRNQRTPESRLPAGCRREGGAEAAAGPGGR